MTHRPSHRLPLALAAGSGPVLAADTPAFVPDRAHTAVLITDPQNDFMSETGKAGVWSART